MSKARTRQLGRREIVSRWAIIPLFAGILSLGGCGKAAPPAKFEAEVKDNTVTIYSNARTVDRCTVIARFTIARNGKRELASHICQNRAIPVGDHVKLSDISDDLIVDAKIESIETHCKSDQAEQTGGK